MRDTPTPASTLESSTPAARSGKPPRLRRNARVALIAPAGPAPTERVDAAIAQCAALGLTAVPGDAVRMRSGYLAGADTARADDLQRAIADPSIDAIWAVRGGYGTMRILEGIDFTPWRDRPRAFIGFSDNTAVHLALARHGHISFHGAHAGAACPPFTSSCFESILFGAFAGPLPMPPRATAPETLRGGRTEGTLAGGNLTMLAALSGTRFALRGRNCIILLEDVGEPAYRVDRALTQLLLSGAFDGAAGFAIGQFTERKTAPGETRLEDVCAERLAPLGAPVLSGLPFGHVDEQWCLPLGVRARMDADARVIELLEAGVE